jgi:acetyl esterase/lipase
MVDNALVAPGANSYQRAALYANGHDLTDPLLSPIFGDMRGFPPAILTIGTRDLFLSSTVLVHRKLRQAGVEAVLQVFEGQSHGQYYRDRDAPEPRRLSRRLDCFLTDTSATNERSSGLVPSELRGLLTFVPGLSDDKVAP